MSLYPFGGRIIDEMAEQLAAFSVSSGAIRFTAEQPLMDALLMAIVRNKVAGIDTLLDA